MANKPLRTPPSKGGDFEIAPAGVFLARCYKMIDLGTQKTESKQYGTKHDRKIMLYWELLQDEDGNDVRMENGKPFMIQKEYTWSMHTKANLRKDLDAWRGIPFTDEEAIGFEISKLLGVACKLQVVHKVSGDRTYANVGSIMTTKQTPEGVNDLVTFSIEDPDMDVYEDLPEWLKDKINAAPEFSGDFADGVEVIEDAVVGEDGSIELPPEGVTEGDIKKTPF